jgi:hypothetical protein
MKILPLVCVRPSEKVAMIHKTGIQSPLGVFNKDGLPIVGVPGANVNQPRQPEACLVADAREAGTRQKFNEPLAIATEVPRAKTESRCRPKTPFRGLYPTVGVPVDE